MNPKLCVIIFSLPKQHLVSELQVIGQLWIIDRH
jgi:hypothetical protein